MKEFEPFRQIYQQILQKQEIKANAKQAAVAVLFIETDDQEPQLVLIERNQYDGHHSGQMALPGGKMDPTDLDLRETAAREVLEEIGVDIDAASLEYVTEHWIHVSNYWITAFSIRLNKKLSYDLNKREINRIFEIPVSTFRDTKFLKAHQLNILGKEYWSPYFEIENEIIWGATALIIYQNIFLKDPFTEIKYE